MFEVYRHTWEVGTRECAFSLGLEGPGGAAFADDCFGEVAMGTTRYIGHGEIHTAALCSTNSTCAHSFSACGADLVAVGVAVSFSAGL